MNRIVVSNETDPCYNLALEEELLEQADSGSTLLYLLCGAGKEPEPISGMRYGLYQIKRHRPGQA